MIKRYMRKYREEIYTGCVALFLFLVFCIVALLYGCGGGGAGGATVSPGVPSPSSTLTLHASKVVETAGNALSLYASVSDGNGKPVEGVTVAFKVTAGNGVLSLPSAKTDSRGVAVATIKSTEPSVTVVTAETPDASATKTLYFVSSPDPKATLYLNADADGDGIYNEQGDFTITADGRSQVRLKATFYNVAGIVEAGRTVIFGADKSVVSFSSTNAITDSSGNAYTTFTATGKDNVVTVYAFETTTGAADIVSFTLRPVVVGSVRVTPDASTIKVGESVGITTCVFDTTGYPVPDNTYIRYSLTPSDAGKIDLFGYTTGGCHNNTLKALKDSNVTITATSQGVSGSTTVSITEMLKVIPESATVDTDTPYTFNITGGVKPYKVSLSSATASIKWLSDSSFQVSDTIAEVVQITVYDSNSDTATATLTVQTQTKDLKIIPDSATATVDTFFTFTVIGGKTPYQAAVSSSNATVEWVDSSHVRVKSSVAETVTLTVFDTNNNTATATLTVQ